MSTPLRVLILEDRAADAELVVAELRRAGFDPVWRRLDTEADFLAELEAPCDVILADYTMPQLDAVRALGLLRERGLDTPFIVVSGSVSEELAVDAMKSGAADYLLKDRLTRLGQAVAHALQQRELLREKRRVDDALRESEERFRRLAEHAPDIIYRYRLEPTRGFEYISPAATAITGHSPEEFYADPDLGFKLAHPDDRALLEQVTFDGGAAGEPVTLRWVRRDGGIIWTEQRNVAIRDGEENVVAVEGIARDVTDRKRLEEQILQSQKMEAIGRLAGGIAHDFNNLLTAIIGYDDLLLEDLGAGDPRRRDAEEIKTAAQRATALIGQLLAFGRQQILQPVVLDLNASVTGMESLLRRLLGEDIELSVALDPALGNVRADPSQIEQVIVNLAVNARDAMPGGGKLTIETDAVELDAAYARNHAEVTPGRYIMLAVSDSGQGMDEATRNHLFEPFFTTKERGAGTGLGLATVYGIVRQSGGHIWVYGEPGRGATFKVYLPRVDEPVSATARAESTAPRGGSETVLLVEDDQAVRTLTEEILGRQGYTVLSAGFGSEALEVAARHEGPIQLLVTDVVMPGQSGGQLAGALAVTRPGMRVLYLSGYTDNTIVHHGVLDPGTAFLGKPFTLDALLRKVREVLDA